MPALDSVMIQCPYCWEMLDISVDPSVEEQEYVEDCQVCCNPILISVLISADGTPQVEARAENE